MLKNEKSSVAIKSSALQTLALHDCDLGKFKEAEEVAKRAIAVKNLRPYDKAYAYVTLSDVYRYQDRYDDAVKVIREAVKLDPKSSHYCLRAGADLAIVFRKQQELEKFTNAMPEYDRFMYFKSSGPSNWPRFQQTMVENAKEAWRETTGKKLAAAFVSNQKNPAGERISVSNAYFSKRYGSSKEADARKSLRGAILSLNEKKELKWYLYPNFADSFQRGDYALSAELFDLFDGTAVFENVKNQKMHVITLGAIGKKAEAVHYAVKYGADPKLSAVDRMRFKFYENILLGKSTDDLLKNSGLTRKEEAQVVLSAARQCLTWNMDELARKYTADYEKYFIKKQDQVMTVKYFEKPVLGINDWRRIRSKLDPQLCDIPFSADLALLETDVATGRSVHFEKNAKIGNFMEMTSFCDENGLHVFLAVEDENARKIEHGFAGGISTEMYFAPGKNQPYSCFGSTPVKGVAFMFSTTYNNRNQRRLNMDDPKLSFRSETAFTDHDYVLHLFFPWDNFYAKLPAHGSEYRFECLSWTPAGGFSWGGSRGIHGASDWGTLKFDLTDQQLNAIRRNLIYKHYKSWKKYQQRPSHGINVFERWSDSGVGDPEFYQSVLVPLEKELDSYAAKVKEDMTDAEVAEVFRKGCIRWMGIRDEIDLLRKQYLLRRIAETGK